MDVVGVLKPNVQNMAPTQQYTEDNKLI
jgi:hypothetical protein